MVRWRRGGERVPRITGARQGLAEDIRGRQRRYVVSMLVRTVSVLLTVSLWNVSRPLAVATLVLGALIPYVAVVVANAGRERPPAMPSTFLHNGHRTALPPPDRQAGEGSDADRPEDRDS